MKKLLLFALLAVLSLLPTQAALITFDDLPGRHQVVPNGYAGLDWTGFTYTDTTSDWAPGFEFGKISGPNVAYNTNAMPSVIASSTAFDLNSAYLTSAYADSKKVTVIGYLNGVEKYHNTYTLSTTSAQLIDFNYLGIDRVEFVDIVEIINGRDTSQFILDNVTVNAVPEPATCLAGVGALAMVALLGFKRRS